MFVKNSCQRSFNIFEQFIRNLFDFQACHSHNFFIDYNRNSFLKKVGKYVQSGTYFPKPKRALLFSNFRVYNCIGCVRFKFMINHNTRKTILSGDYTLCQSKVAYTQAFLKGGVI